jgi:hypothetical protein
MTQREENAMESVAYEQLAEALDRLPNGFPRTDSGVELEILRRIFAPEEAHIAGQLDRHHRRYEVVAEHAQRPIEHVKSLLEAMTKLASEWRGVSPTTVGCWDL